MYKSLILRADQILATYKYAQLSPTRRRNLIFVIDQCGLEIPLCECLRQLRNDGVDGAAGGHTDLVGQLA